jgi:glycosyltransferase involved in cell wall biosynthesis
MRFCLFTTFYPPFNFGGDGIDVQRTARALVARGHDVTVVHDIDAHRWLSGLRLPPQPRQQDGVEVIGLVSRLGVVASFLTHQLGRPVVHRRRIETLIRDRHFDVVVFNNVSLVGGPDLLSFGGDALRVYMAHEHWLVCPTHVLWRYNREPCDARSCTRCVISYRRPPQLWRYTNALDRATRHVDLFVARSEFSRKKHAEFGFKPAMAVLPYFLPDVQPGTVPTRTARPHDRPYFLYVGRLTKIKGVESVIPAFQAYPHADLLIIGDGEELESLRTLAKDVPNVKFLGRVANDRLSPYYEHAIAALVPSVGFETFGIVLIEAFRQRTPVIARRIGPFPEIVEAANGGILFSDTKELMTALDRMQHDSALRESLATSAARAADALWSEHAVIGRFLELISTATAARAASRVT